MRKGHRVTRRQFLAAPAGAALGVAAGDTEESEPPTAAARPTGKARRRRAKSGVGEIREMAMGLPRVDTHSHFYTDIPDLRKMAQECGDFGATANLTDSRIRAAGCRKLYGIDPGLYLRPDSPPALFEAAAELRAQGPAKALEAALDAEGITTQFCFCAHRPEDSPLPKLSPRVRLLAYIDAAVCGMDYAFCPDGRGVEFNYYDSLCGHFGPLATLDDYLGAIDACVDSWRDHGVVGMKTAIAYSIGLSIGDPDRETARAAFARKRDMAPHEVTAVQHYAFRNAMLACRRNALPVVVHTGFQIWGHADLRQSNPILLHNLLIDERYKDVTFVLLHGGNPYVGETTYLARMFPNVNIDFTWISWMTAPRFRMALAEWLEIVPHGKMCWGSDSSCPETIVGIGQLTRTNIADVLEDQIERRVLDVPVAGRFLELAYQETPKRLFQL